MSIVGIFLSLWYLVEIKFSAIISLINILFLAHILYQERIDKEILIATLFALVLTSYYTYTYSSANYFIGTINLFPLLGWTAGLVFTLQIYRLFKKRSQRFAMYAIVITYLVVLFSIEFLGFYLLNIQLASNYPSLLGIGIIHGPIGMKAFYLTAGPLYVLVTEFILGKKKI